MIFFIIGHIRTKEFFILEVTGDLVHPSWGPLWRKQRCGRRPPNIKIERYCKGPQRTIKKSIKFIILCYFEGSLAEGWTMVTSGMQSISWFPLPITSQNPIKNLKFFIFFMDFVWVIGWQGRLIMSLGPFSYQDYTLLALLSPTHKPTKSIKIVFFRAFMRGGGTGNVISWAK